MKKRLIKIIALLLFISVSIGLNKGLNLFHSTVRAVGDLTVDWGVPEGSPIFVINNFAPGEVESRDVLIQNSVSSIRPVGVRGIETEQLKNLADKLFIKIFSGGDTYYGGPGSEKTLTQFFSESSGPDGIELFNLNPGTDKTITFQVTFDPQAGNDYQEARVVFDLRIGIAIEIPAQCSGIVFAGDPIFGTESNDNIRGTNKNDLIYGFEGNDKISSSNGNDCVVGGPGNDNINNSNGNDVLFGNDGDDTLNGSNGNDKIFAGNGNDKLYGSNGNDQLEGEDGDDFIDGSNGDDRINGGIGNDQIEGSNGNDIVHGNAGNDKIDGGNGIDQIYGGYDNDEMSGSNGNDLLDGGIGTDKAVGNNGFDTCDAEVESTCEF